MSMSQRKRSPNMRGLVIGKFYPPHLGHNYLIDAALADCDEVDVLVVDNPRYKIAAAERAHWLQAHHPRANVQIIPDINKDDNSEAWAVHTKKFLGYAPDVVYSSERYGVTWAQCMGSRHVMVDNARKAVPISGTKVRENILDSWRYLSGETKAGLALRIVIVGAESTGTTTLTCALAKHYHAPWVPELGRYYTESILPSGADWSLEDFHRIGELQQHYEAAIASRSNGLVFCDTNATATLLWQDRYCNEITPTMHQIAARDKADLYILTGDEIPFIQDGIRDGEAVRHHMHGAFKQLLASLGVPWIYVRGTPEVRLKKAVEHIDRTISTLAKI